MSLARMGVACAFFLFACPVIPVQKRPIPGRNPQAQLLQYYHQYPDRYIRVSKESWHHNERMRSASHTFTLYNSAGVAYCDIEMRFAYQDAKGQPLHTRTLKLPDIVRPYTRLEIKGVLVKNVPGGAINVLVSVAGAMVSR